MRKTVKFVVVITIFLCIYLINTCESVASTIIDFEPAVIIHNVDEYKEFAINCEALNGYEGKLVNLEADLDFGGNANNPTPVVEGTFKGIFNGNGHKLKNIYISSEKSKDAVLFIENEGTIKKIIVESGTIIGKYGAASIVGRNSGLIEQCANYVNIQTGYNGGGICVWNEKSGVVRYCYNRGNITDLAPGGGGTIGFGGIVGYDYSGSVVACYNTGIIAPERKGGNSNISGWFWDDDKHYTEKCYYPINNSLEDDKYFIGANDLSGYGILDKLNASQDVFVIGADNYPTLDMSVVIKEPTNYLERKKELSEKVEEEPVIDEEEPEIDDLKEPDDYIDEDSDSNPYHYNGDSFQSVSPYEYDTVEEGLNMGELLTKVLIVLTFLAVIAVIWIVFLLAMIGKLEAKK